MFNHKLSLINYIILGIGGAAGAILRVVISSLFNNIFIFKFIPTSIILVNITGCFIMGLASELMGVYIPASYNLRLFLVSGFLGAFTTFSAFSLEFGLLIQKNQYILAGLYVVLSVLFSLCAFLLGVKIIKLI